MEKTNSEHIEYDVICLDLDKSGYGPDGSLTRREWQKECLRQIQLGKDSFNAWQEVLLRARASRPVKEPWPTFKWAAISKRDPEHQIVGPWLTELNSILAIDIANCRLENSLVFGFDFRTGVVFTNVDFGEPSVSFDGRRFMGTTYFIGCRFRGSGSFNRSEFHRLTRFDYSIFKNTSHFFDARFIESVHFFRTQFEQGAYFKKATIRDGDFDGAVFFDTADFSGLNADDSEKLQTFGRISLSGTDFRGPVTFNNRHFMGSLRLRPVDGVATRFAVAPHFHNCKLHQDTTFLECIFPKPGSTDKSAALAYNTLRLAMSQRQSVHEEQMFLRLEYDCERLSSSRTDRWLYSTYKWFANYGFSVWRPLLRLVALPAFFFFLVYALMASESSCLDLSTISCEFNSAVAEKAMEITMINALPPLGFDKSIEQLRTNLFGARSPWFSLVTIALFVTQRCLSLLGWFLVALAFRNQFKMK